MNEASPFPSISSSEATLWRLLCGEGRHLSLSIDGTFFDLTFQIPSSDDGTPMSQLPIEVEGEVSWIGIHFRPDGILAGRVPGGLPASPDLLRKALLGMMCRDVLNALASSLNCSIRIVANESLEGKGTAVGFSIRSLADTKLLPEAWGILRLGEKFTKFLITAAVGWACQEGRLPGVMQVDCPIILATISMTLKELLSLHLGDLLLLGERDSINPVIRLADGRHFKCLVRAFDELSMEISHGLVASDK